MNVILGKLQEIFKSTQKSELEGVFSANNNHADKCTYEKFRFVYFSLLVTLIQFVLSFFENNNGI